MKTFSFDVHDAEGDLPYHGALIPVTLTAPVTLVSFWRESGFPLFAERSGYALIDTGARRSGVDAETMAELEIPSVGEEPFLTTHGIANLPLYNLSATLPDLDTGLLTLKRAPGGLVRNELFRGKHIIMLLGRDLLQRLVLTYDGPKAIVTLQA